MALADPHFTPTSGLACLLLALFQNALPTWGGGPQGPPRPSPPCLGSPRDGVSCAHSPSDGPGGRLCTVLVPGASILPGGVVPGPGPAAETGTPGQPLPSLPARSCPWSANCHLLKPKLTGMNAWLPLLSAAPHADVSSVLGTRACPARLLAPSLVPTSPARPTNPPLRRSCQTPEIQGDPWPTSNLP